MKPAPKFIKRDVSQEKFKPTVVTTITAEEQSIEQTLEYSDNEPEETIYDIQKSIQANLVEDEVKMYGVSRCPNGYSKLDLLGKGGCAVVWLCQGAKGNKVAVK